MPLRVADAHRLVAKHSAVQRRERKGKHTRGGDQTRALLRHSTSRRMRESCQMRMRPVQSQLCLFADRTARPARREGRKWRAGGGRAGSGRLKRSFNAGGLATSTPAAAQCVRGAGAAATSPQLLLLLWHRRHRRHQCGRRLRHRYGRWVSAQLGGLRAALRAELAAGSTDGTVDRLEWRGRRVERQRGCGLARGAVRRCAAGVALGGGQLPLWPAAAPSDHGELP
jgi:hypothetical protein